MQLVAEADEFDRSTSTCSTPTKIIPEELVPVRPVGRMVLNRNPDNFFAETEQVAFHVGNVVPGIDFTDDPLLQARLFSYLDTQLIRLGGPNFPQIPINRPVAPVRNHQRDGYHQHRDPDGAARTTTRTRSAAAARCWPATAAFTHYPERVDGPKGPQAHRELRRPLRAGDACSGTA